MSKRVSVSLLLVLLAAGLTYGQSSRNQPSELFPIYKDRKWGYIDNTGKVVIEPKFDEAREFVDGLAIVKMGGRYGYVDTTGQIAIDVPFDSVSTIHQFSEGLALIHVGGIGYRYIDKKGQVVLAPKADQAWDFSEGLARINQFGKWGYMDKTGQIVIEPIYDEAKDFSGGLARVELGRRWGYIDKTGKFIWRLTY